jgi:hypothetical protein
LYAHCRSTRGTPGRSDAQSEELPSVGAAPAAGACIQIQLLGGCTVEVIVAARVHFREHSIHPTVLQDATEVIYGAFISRVAQLGDGEILIGRDDSQTKKQQTHGASRGGRGRTYDLREGGGGRRGRYPFIYQNS